MASKKGSTKTSTVLDVSDIDLIISTPKESLPTDEPTLNKIFVALEDKYSELNEKFEEKKKEFETLRDYLNTIMDKVIVIRQHSLEISNGKKSTKKSSTKVTEDVKSESDTESEDVKSESDSESEDEKVPPKKTAGRGSTRGKGRGRGRGK